MKAESGTVYITQECCKDHFSIQVLAGNLLPLLSRFLFPRQVAGLSAAWYLLSLVALWYAYGCCSLRLFKFSYLRVSLLGILRLYNQLVVVLLAFSIPSFFE